MYEESGLKMIREKDNANINAQISIMRFLRFDNTSKPHYNRRDGVMIDRIEVAIKNI